MNHNMNYGTSGYYDPFIPNSQEQYQQVQHPSVSPSFSVSSSPYGCDRESPYTNSVGRLTDHSNASYNQQQYNNYQRSYSMQNESSFYNANQPTLHGNFVLNQYASNNTLVPHNLSSNNELKTTTEQEDSKRPTYYSNDSPFNNGYASFNKGEANFSPNSSPYDQSQKQESHEINSSSLTNEKSKKDNRDNDNNNSNIKVDVKNSQTLREDGESALERLKEMTSSGQDILDENHGEKLNRGTKFSSQEKREDIVENFNDTMSACGNNVDQSINNQHQPYLQQNMQMQGSNMHQFRYVESDNSQPGWNPYNFPNPSVMYSHQSNENIDEFSSVRVIEGYHGMSSENNPSNWLQPDTNPRSDSPSLGMGFRMPINVTNTSPWGLRGSRPDHRIPDHARGGNMSEESPHEGIKMTPPNVPSPSSPYSTPTLSFQGPESNCSSTGNRGGKRGPGRPRGIESVSTPLVPGLHESTGKATKSNSSLSNKKKYVCEICQKKFSTAWYVRVHRRSHDGDRPHVCKNCNKGFMLPNVLQVHLRKCLKNNSGNNANLPPPSQSSPGDLTNQSVSQDPITHISSPLSSGPSIGGSFTQPPFVENGGGSSSNLTINQHQTYGLNMESGSYNNHQSFTTNYTSGFNSNHSFEIGLGQQNFNAESHEGRSQQNSSFDISSPQPPIHNSTNASVEGSRRGQFSDVYSPHGAASLAALEDPPTSVANNPFLGNDRPPDEGGGQNNSDMNSPEDKVLSNEVNNGLYCIMCELHFDDRSLLEEHQRNQHRSYSCKICEKKFSQKCNLITHMRLHTGEKPYLCSFCDKRFTQKGNLEAHLKTHTKEKPYNCPQCENKFAFKSAMISHLKQAHQSFGISPISTSGYEFEEDQTQYSTTGATSSGSNSSPPNNFSPGIPTPQSSLDSLSGSNPNAYHQSFAQSGNISSNNLTEEECLSSNSRIGCTGPQSLTIS